MHPVLRALPIALGWLSAAVALRAPAEVLPPIFAPRVAEPLTPPVPPLANPSGSERMRKLVSERVLARAAVFEVPAALPLPRHARDETPIVMERFIVDSSPMRARPLQVPDPPMLRFLKTGTIYHHIGPKRETHVSLDILLLQAIGPHRNEEFTRYELRFNFRF